MNKTPVIRCSAFYLPGAAVSVFGHALLCKLLWHTCQFSEKEQATIECSILLAHRSLAAYSLLRFVVYAEIIIYLLSLVICTLL